MREETIQLDSAIAAFSDFGVYIEVTLKSEKQKRKKQWVFFISDS